MYLDPIQPWLASGWPATIAGSRLWPVAHPLLKDQPLAMQRGQAVALLVRASDGTHWFIKRFLEGKKPDEAYLKAVADVLPRHSGLVAGTRRRVLHGYDIRSERDGYNSTELRDRLDQTVLMPRVPGDDWASLADDIRSGARTMNLTQRIGICRSLAEIVAFLETNRIAHRDLSCGNVFVVLDQHQVSLIDFDSIYHPRLSMPTGTTSGSEGYMAPFLWSGGRFEARSTWACYADRFALALLIVEFLTVEKGSPISGDGGLFEQDDLRHRRGRTLTYVRDRLAVACPQAESIFDRAIESTSFKDCPSPQDWLRLLDIVDGASALTLSDVEKPSPAYFRNALRGRAQVPKFGSAPSLAEMPMPSLAGVHGAPSRISTWNSAVS